jgi:small subunit ribosomal protein S1
MSFEEIRSSSPGAETGAEPAPAAESPEAQPDASQPGEIENLLDQMETLPTTAQGEIVRGTVVKITETEVIVDVGLKSEAALLLSECQSEDGTLPFNAGDAIDVFIEQYDEMTGLLAISYQKAARRRVWDEIEAAFRDQRTLTGRVVERVKGGLGVDIGVRAFLPGSQADLRPHANLESLLGQEIACRVIRVNRKRNNVVVSRRAVLEEVVGQRKARLLEELAEGSVVVGRVKNLTDYGAFIDLGGLDGLLHITDLSWGRVGHPSEILKVGQEVRAQVLKFDREKERVSLGLKQLTPDPWESAPAIYRPGGRWKGRVVGIVDYGAFVELEPGVEGLIHISEMSWGKRLKHPSKTLKLGDQVEVAVLDVSPEQRRISLSLKQTQPDPWSTLPERYAEGSIIQGRVRNLTAFGAFVEVEEGVDGLIHLSNLSWTKSVKHPSEVLRKGQRVEAVVLSVDTGNRRLSLGLKQLQPNIWEEFFSRVHVGDILRGRVTRRTTFGAFVELEPGIEGLCHVSELGDAAKPEPGSEIRFRIIRLNPEERKIGLSLKGVEQEEPPVEAEPAASLEPEAESAPPDEEQIEAEETSAAAHGGMKET